MISVGIDCGAKNTKSVVVKDQEIMGKGLALTGSDQRKAIREALAAALEKAGISEGEVRRQGATGSGKNVAKDALPVDDVKAIGRGANFFFPSARTVVDVGAEEGRAAKLDEKGNAVDFALNEKCAAGAGAFIEAMGRALETPLTDMGPLALKSRKQIPMNAQCVIFAESEVVGLIHARAEKEDISKAIHDAMASRIVSVIRRIGVNPEVVLLGGVAHNPAFVAALKRELALDTLLIPDGPEYGAAVGAALIAAED